MFKNQVPFCFISGIIPAFKPGHNNLIHKINFDSMRRIFTQIPFFLKWLSCKTRVIFSIVFFALLIIVPFYSFSQSTVYPTNGSYTFTVPANVTAVRVETWGGGGAGGGVGSVTGASGGGGGGGAYARSILTVIPGNSYPLSVGAGGIGVLDSAGRHGAASWFSSATTVLATAGTGGFTNNVRGQGGAAALSVGNIKYSGADGDNGVYGPIPNGGYGGGGGSSAGTGLAGNSPLAATPWLGGVAPAGGGNGGNGAIKANSTPDNGNGNPAPGVGGGGGAAKKSSGTGSSFKGGNGHDGQVIVSWPAITSLGSVSGCEGTVITINGTNLSGATAVTIGVMPAVVVSSTSTQIIATIGGGPGGTVTVTTDYGTVIGTDNFTVYPKPGATIVSGGGSFCESTVITAENGNSGIIYYQGTTSNGTSTADPSITKTITISGTYYFRALSSNNCWGDEGNAIVTINPNPTVDAGPALNAICQGASTPALGGTFGGSATGATWDDGGAGGTFTNNDGSNPAAVTYTAATNAPALVTLTLTTSGGSCGTVNASKSLTVNPLITGNISGDAFVCQDATAPVITFTASNNGIAPYTFTYNINGLSTQSITTTTGNSVSITVPMTPGSFTYTLLTVQDAGGSPCSQLQATTATVIIKEPVAITTEPLPVTTCASYPVSFSVTATGDSLHYQWYKNGIPLADNANISGTKTAQLDIDQTQSSDIGNYYVLVSGSLACSPVPSASVLLDVKEQITITAQPAPLGVCTGGTASFTVTASGTGIQYQWQKGSVNLTDGGNISGSSTPVLTITNVSAADAANYRVVLTSLGTCPQAISTRAKLTVNPIPTVNAVDTQVVCSGSTYAGLSFSGSVVGTVYKWTNDDPSIGLATSGAGDIPSFTAINSGTEPIYAHITVTPEYTNAGATCTGAPLEFVLAVNTGATVDAVSDQVICNGGTTNAVHFTSPATGGTVVFNWENDNPAIGLALAGTGDILSFTGSNIGTSPITATITVKPTYTNVLSTCVGVPYSFTITVNPSPAVNAIADQVVCSGTTIPAINFSSAANGGTVTYNWTNSDPSIGLPASGSGDILSFTATNNTASTITAVIKVKATFTNGAVGCQGPEQTFQVIVYPAVTLTANPSMPEICSESTTNISLTSNAASAFFSWTVLSETDATGASGGNGPSIQQSLSATGTNNGTVVYQVDASANDCFAPPVTISVTVKPIATITPLTQSICNESAINPITLAALPAGTITSWTRDNPSGISSSIPMSGSGPVSGTFTNSNTIATPVNFMVTAQAGNGCVVTKPVLVNVFANVNPVTISSSQIVCEGKSTAPLTSTAPAGGSDMGYSYQWQSADTTIGPWISIPGATNANYKPPTAPKYYRLVVTNSCDADTSNWVQIETDEAIGDTRKGQPFPLSICDDQSFHYHVETVAPKNTTRYIKYTWSSPNPGYFTSDTTNPFGTENDELFTTRYFADLDFKVHNKSNVSREGNFVLTPVIYNPSGTVHCALDPVINTIIIDPVPVISNATTTTCSGTAFSVSPANGNPVSNVVPPDTKYSWTAPVVTGGLMGGSVQTAQATISQVLTNPTSTVQTATYTVTPLTDSGCGGNSFTVEVKVNPRPVIDTQYLTVCTGVTFSFAPVNNEPVTIIPAGTTYSWLAPTGTNFTGGLSGNGSSITGTLSTINPIPVTATYKVTPTAGAAAGGCSGEPFYLKVTINPKATAIFNSDETIVCYNGGTNINFSGSPNTIVSYTVNGTPQTITLNNAGVAILNTGVLTSNTTYALTGVGYPSPGATCTQPLSGSITVIVHQPASATIAHDPTAPICAGELSTLTFSGTANTVVTYNDGIADQTITLDAFGKGSVVVSPLLTTTYELVNIAYTGTPSCVQPVAGNTTVLIIPDAKAGVLSGANEALCVGSTVQLTSNGNGGGNWSSSNATVATINASGMITAHSAGTADIFYAINTICNGIDSATISILVNANANAGTISGINELCINSQVQFSTSGDAGGTWMSSNTTVADVSSTGMVTTGNTPGTVTISYVLTSGCNASPGNPVTTSILVKVVDAGSVVSGPVDGDPTVCANTDGLIYSTPVVTNAIQYFWTVPADWTITSGQNTNSIIIHSGNLSGNIQVNAGNTCGYGPASNLAVTVLPRGQWFGYDNDWNNSANWCGGVPDGSTDVIIPATGPGPQYFMPRLTADGTAHNLDIASNMRLNLNGHVFTLNGTLSGTGTFVGSPTSGLIITGNAGTVRFTPNIFPAAPTNNYLKTLEVQASASALLGDSLNIAAGNFADGYGKINVNGYLNANGRLSLLSDALGTAMVGISNGTIDGEVTVQRYFPAYLAWRFVGIPFNKTSTQTINQAWQEGNVDVNLQCPPQHQGTPGFGTAITFNNINGYDIHNNNYNTSIQVYLNNAWVTPPNTYSSLAGTPNSEFPAYCLFVRGDRSVCLDKISPATITTLRPKGILNQTGPGIIRNLPAGNTGEYIMVGNPYAAPVDITSALTTASNIDNDKFLVWDPKINNYGGYVTISISSGIISPANTNYSAGTIIQSSQAFMVQRKNSGTATMNFKETDKVESYQQDINVFGITAKKLMPSLPVAIFVNLLNTDNKLMDGVAATFNKKYAAKADEKDVSKRWNEYGDNMALRRDGKSLAIEMRPIPTTMDTLFLELYLTQKPYKLQVFSQNLPKNAGQAWIVDKYLGTKTQLNLYDTTLYIIKPGADTNSYRNRFMLVFNTARPNMQGQDNGQINAYIYPNPVSGKTFKLVMQNGIKGNYTINITTIAGKLIASRIINYNYGSDTYTITAPATLTTGTYIVQILNEKQKVVGSMPLIIGK